MLADVLLEAWGMFGTALIWLVATIGGAAAVALALDFLRLHGPRFGGVDRDATACTLPDDYDDAPEELVQAAREIAEADIQEFACVDEWGRPMPLDEIDRLYLEAEIGPGR